jgi:hypothetical protein
MTTVKKPEGGGKEDPGMMGRRSMKKIRVMVVASFLFAGLVLLNTGCASYIRQLSVTPEVGSLEIENGIPMEIALLITEEVRDRIFISPRYPEYQINPPFFILEPFQLPIGRAFEAAAVEVFARVFKKVTLVRTLEQAGTHLPVVEPKLEDFTLRLTYYTFEHRFPYNQSADGKCQAKISTSVFSKGKLIWRKSIKTPRESGFWVTTPWLGDKVGELAADTLVSGLKDLALQLAKDNPLR